MTIVPAMTFAVGVGLALAFEVAYSFIDSKLRLSLEQWQWTFLYWMALGILGVTTGLVPSKPALSTDWIPLFFVAVSHVGMNLFEPGALTLRRRHSCGHADSDPEDDQPSAPRLQSQSDHDHTE